MTILACRNHGNVSEGARRSPLETEIARDLSERCHLCSRSRRTRSACSRSRPLIRHSVEPFGNPQVGYREFASSSCHLRETVDCHQLERGYILALIFWGAVVH